MQALVLNDRYLAGDRAPTAGCYQEHDARTWKPVRFVLLAEGLAFPAVTREGGFFTLLRRGAGRRAVRGKS